MGTGKSAVGKVLAKRLHRKFVELDRLIERHERKSIAKIFADKGEAYFRRIERKMLQKALLQHSIVLSTGGGVILNPLNRGDMKKRGIIICLTASLKEIYHRIAQNSYRPLLQNKNPFQTVKKLLKSRRPFYLKAGKIFLSSTGKTATQTAKAILKRLEKLK